VQWIFLTDEAAAAADGSPQQAQGIRHSGGDPCPIMAVCLAGAPTALDWLPPSVTQEPRATGGAGNSRLSRPEPRQQLSFMAASNLLVQTYDMSRGLWVVQAHTHAGIATVSGSDMRVRELSAWARQNQAALDACRAKVQQLLGA